MKKILVLYATAGVGHKKAAFAVKAALDELAPANTEVSVIDALDYTNAFVRWAYLKVFIFMVNWLPTFWGIGYYITNNPSVDFILRKIGRLADWVNSKKLREYLVQAQPDVIITTHFFASNLACDLKKKNMLRSHVITVVTDYRFHLWWVSSCTDTYIVGSEQARMDLLQSNISSSRIRVDGIPVDPAFSKPLNKKEILQRMDLHESVPTMLVLGGGLGFGPIENIVKVIDDIPQPTQTIAICGRNEELFRRLESLRPKLKKEIRIFGFVDNVFEYMEASDILITKPGGITSTESLAKGLPLVIVSPIIGQETRNSAYLTREGAAVRIDRFPELRGVLEDLISSPEKMKKMREAAGRLKKPNACYDITRLAIELCSEYGSSI